MKSIIQYIKESLVFEGGHSVENATPIRGDLAKVVADEIISNITKEFNCKASALGSTGKKSKEQTSGDIDIAFELSWEDKDKVIDFVKKTFGSEIGNINESLHVFNIGYKYNEDGTEKIVQVDFMFVNDVDFAKFAYHSPDFTKNESKYKGMYQSNLLMAVVSNTPVEGKEETKFTDEFDGKYSGQTKEFYKYQLSQAEGLLIVKKSFEGKTKPLASPKTISKEKVTTNVRKILDIVLGKESNESDCNSFESLLDYLVSDKYPRRSKEMMENIKKSYLEDWQFKMKTDKSLVDEFTQLLNKAIEYLK